MASTNVGVETNGMDGLLASMARPGQVLKVVAKSRKGEVLYGTCGVIDIAATSFEIQRHDKTGAPLNSTTTVPFEALKALFFVKQFDGTGDVSIQSLPVTPASPPVAVEFLDGEIFIGRPISQDFQHQPRAFFKPEDTGTNNLLVLVQRSYVKEFYSVEEHKRRVQQEFRAFAQTNFLPGESQEECMGDFFFTRHNYFRAAEHYFVAFENDPANVKLRHKLCTAHYNVGAHHIRQKHYAEALRAMERVLSLDAGFADAQEKARKLNERLRVHQSLEDVRASRPDPVDSIRMQRFIDCRWIWEHQHFIMTGPAHSGKTRLACSLGHKVSKKGLHVAYQRIPNLVKDLQAAKLTRSDIQMLVALEKTDFLILDDWDHSSIPEEQRSLLREVITSRYLRRATLFIAELPEGQWHHLFGERIASDPVLYKVLNDAHKIHLEPRPGA